MSFIRKRILIEIDKNGEVTSNNIDITTPIDLGHYGDHHVTQILADVTNLVWHEADLDDYYLMISFNNGIDDTITLSGEPLPSSDEDYDVNSKQCLFWIDNSITTINNYENWRIIISLREKTTTNNEQTGVEVFISEEFEGKVKSSNYNPDFELYDNQPEALASLVKPRTIFTPAEDDKSSIIISNPSQQKNTYLVGYKYDQFVRVLEVSDLIADEFTNTYVCFVETNQKAIVKKLILSEHNPMWISWLPENVTLNSGNYSAFILGVSDTQQFVSEVSMLQVGNNFLIDTPISPEVEAVPEKLELQNAIWEYSGSSWEDIEWEIKQPLQYTFKIYPELARNVTLIPQITEGYTATITPTGVERILTIIPPENPQSSDTINFSIEFEEEAIELYSGVNHKNSSPNFITTSYLEAINIISPGEGSMTEMSTTPLFYYTTTPTYPFSDEITTETTGGFTIVNGNINFNEESRQHQITVGTEEINQTVTFGSYYPVTSLSVKLNGSEVTNPIAATKDVWVDLNISWSDGSSHQSAFENYYYSITGSLGDQRNGNILKIKGLSIGTQTLKIWVSGYDDIGNYHTEEDHYLEKTIEFNISQIVIDSLTLTSSQPETAIVGQTITIPFDDVTEGADENYHINLKYLISPSNYEESWSVVSSDTNLTCIRQQSTIALEVKAPVTNATLTFKHQDNTTIATYTVNSYSRISLETGGWRERVSGAKYGDHDLWTSFDPPTEYYPSPISAYGISLEANSVASFRSLSIVDNVVSLPNKFSPETEFDFQIKNDSQAQGSISIGFDNTISSSKFDNNGLYKPAKGIVLRRTSNNLIVSATDGSSIPSPASAFVNVPLRIRFTEVGGQFWLKIYSLVDGKADGSLYVVSLGSISTGSIIMGGTGGFEIVGLGAQTVEQ